ncbi:MAG TPA: hypothetical protein VEZ43_01375 [Dongiaceae bacterium]|nr:hypothetical protein [Dongiaceae bacterium]
MNYEIDWEGVKANLDRLTSEALIEIARIIRDELAIRKSKGATELANYGWDQI